MAIAAVQSLAGCALEVENPKPAQELAQRGRTPGAAGIERLERSS